MSLIFCLEINIHVVHHIEYMSQCAYYNYTEQNDIWHALHILPTKNEKNLTILEHQFAYENFEISTM